MRHDGHVSYTVFARKYRPKTFADVLGQEHVVRTLENAIKQERLAQAYLFVGPRGTGKTSTARIFAKALNCPGGPKVDFNPEDDVCREIAEGRSLDVLEIDGASNNGVDYVRDLREKIGFAPAVGKFTIIYIDEVHMLSTGAFNALLKTLEEPPAHVKFIFATTEAHKILPTILSRCQRFDLRRIPSNIIADHLMHIAELENVKLDRLAAHAISRVADGGMRDAQSMLDQLVAFCGTEISEADVMHIFGVTSHETVANLSDKILRNHTAAALTALHTEAESGKDLAKLLTDLIFHFRNVLVYQVDPEVAMKELPKEMADLMAEQSKLVSNDKLMNLLDQFAEVEASIRWAPNKRLCFEIGIIKAAQTLSEVTLNDVIVALHGSLGNGPLPAASPAPAAAPRPRAAEVQAESIAPAMSPAPVSAPVSAPVAEVPEEPAPTPAPEPAKPVKALVDPNDGAKIWSEALQEFHDQMPLVASWAAAGVFDSIKGTKFIIAFSPNDAMASESVQRPTTRVALEKIIENLCGKHYELVATISETIQTPIYIAPPDEEEAPPPEPEPAPAPVAEVKKPAKPNKNEPEPPNAVEEAFRDDPFIREALTIFEAKLADT